MTAVQMTYDNRLMRGDFLRNGGNAVLGQPLSTAVLVSLFTDRRADTVGNDLEDVSQGGWWADTFAERPIGSRLWTLRRSVATRANLNLAKNYIEEALQWMLDDGVARLIEVTTLRGRSLDWLQFTVKVFRPMEYSPWTAAWEVQFDAL
jgi:phage gp46-like protein